MVNAFRIISIDMDGHVGRKFHPDETDIGLIVTPVKLDVMFFDEKAGIVEPVLDQNDEVLDAAVPLLIGIDGEGDQYIETCYTCLTPDGRLLELMDFEIEPIFEGDI